MPTLSESAAKATVDNLHASIAAISIDMQKTPLSIEERRAIHSRCKALFTQLEALRESGAFYNDQSHSILDIMFKMNDLFENFLNLVPLTPTAYCPMH